MLIDVFMEARPRTKTEWTKLSAQKVACWKDEPFEALKHVVANIFDDKHSEERKVVSRVRFWHGLIDEKYLSSLPPHYTWKDCPWKQEDGEPWHTFGGRIREKAVYLGEE